MLSLYNLFESKNISDYPSEILKITSKIKYDDFTDEEKYIVKSPKEVLSKKQAVCYDLVELERELFKKYNYEVKTFFAYDKNEDGETHTFLIFKENNKYYWFESSWQSYRAIHGPFNSYKDGLKYFSNQAKKSLKWKHVYIIEYPSFNYNGMNLNEFGEYIVNHFKGVYYD